MPRAVDVYGPAKITHHPTQRLDTAIGKLPPFDMDTAIDQWITAVKDFTGIDLSGIKSLLETLFGGIDWSHPPTPEQAWQMVVTLFISPLNLLLGPTSPLNAANIFGQLQMPQFGGGVSITDLTTATSNLLQPFTATSVPTNDGWSFNETEDAAQVVADGTTKSLWLRSGVIKVEQGQPLNISVKVKYSGIASGPGQTIRLVLETFESADGTGAAVPVTVAAITNPAGTITAAVTLADTSWDIPDGVQSVRPVLVVDEAVSAGVVYWCNVPQLHKVLLGVLADGIGPCPRVVDTGFVVTLLRAA